MDTLTPDRDSRLIAQLLRYARPHGLALGVSLALLMAVAALQLVQPYLIKLVIDDVLTPAAGAGSGLRAVLAAKLPTLGALYFGAVLAVAVLEYAQVYLLRRTGQAIIMRIREDVFAHLQGLDLAYFDANPVGRLVTRVTNDVEALNEMYTSVLVNLFKDLFFVAGAMAVMLSLDWRLALVSFAVIPVIAGASWVFQRLNREAWRAVRTHLAGINAGLSEGLSGMRAVKIFAREAAEAAAFGSENEAHYRASMGQLRVYAVFAPMMDFLVALALVLVIGVGGLQLLAGALSFGTLFAFTSYTRQLYEPIKGLAEKWNMLQSALAGAERIFELMSTPAAVCDPARPVAAIAGAPAVEFRDVHFAYRGEEWVLAGVSFTVMPGETVAFVGHTGAGKSTIMSLVARFYDVQKGAVLVDGVDVRDWSQAELRRRVGTVLQDVFLFAGDVAGNLSLHDPRLGRAQIEAAARVVGAEGFIRALSGGYDEPVVERGMTLSAGQRQLISFARALAYDPAILVLDEATANIDSETESALQQAMKAIARDRTTLVVAHRLSTIQDASRIYVMHKGEIREEGRHHELLALGGLYHRLWQLQVQSTGPLPHAAPRSPEG